MQILQDRAYFAGRAAKARALALAAREPCIRNIHLEMAKRYEGLAGDEMRLQIDNVHNILG